MDVVSVDKNFSVKEEFGREDIVFRSIDESPFSVHGVRFDGKRYGRMPEDVAYSVSEGVGWLSCHAAGGRVRFRTNSPFVAIRVALAQVSRLPHFPFTGSAGVDLYDGGKYVNTFMPRVDVVDHLSGLRAFHTEGMHDVTINLPPYSAVTAMEIGLQEGARLEAPTPYTYQTPIVYYGSSITQGGCTSRPGNTYEEIISRRLDTDYINLGFSGSAKGESAMSAYIQALDMSVFVYDYDYNAVSAEQLQATHERMFKEIRAAKPTLPIIMASRPIPYMVNEEERVRRDIVRATYENAVAAGDTNVYFVDGSTIFDRFGGDSCTVDAVHPNDLGFMCMAEAFAPIIERCLKK